MQRELINETLVAAEVARQEGYKETYLALLELVKEMAKDGADSTHSSEISNA